MSYSASNYISDAHRTAPEQSHFVVFDEERHAIYGIVTEAAEIMRFLLLTGGVISDDEYGIHDREKWRDELGDVMWYVALALHFYDRDIKSITNFDGRNLSNELVVNASDPYNVQPVFSVMSISHRAGMLLDLLKKRDAYGKTFDVNDESGPKGSSSTPVFLNESMPIPILKMIVLHVEDLAIHLGYTLEEIMESNIAKLKARFPEKFEADLAINKDPDAELEAQRRV
jgi:NTP pyrophosphatase (non-canonical NTP hydrolase)